ncbi:hypothetical protein QQS21_008789 [Conoideocrella luteorostrata]|uniref:Uncharacterized protein n=1 Tax=Conoideocrella luteorostrata TaxID=1105319 RepID=A0AAJ0CKK7_9HYPO|nr:hypothetical protein QQS21_008789 [Conoideocrella luteorostrata]
MPGDDTGLIILELETVAVPCQELGWTCGLFVLESVRLFFSEQHQKNQGDIWSCAYADYATLGHIETLMVSLWLEDFKRELGSPHEMRYPATPGLEFSTTAAADGTKNEIPNHHWFPENQTAKTADGPISDGAVHAATSYFNDVPDHAIVQKEAEYEFSIKDDSQHWGKTLSSSTHATQTSLEGKTGKQGAAQNNKTAEAYGGNSL